MKVILLQKVKGLGDVDDVKETSEGYARNFLFPKHLAVQASAKLLGEIEAKQRRESKEAGKDLQEQQALAQRVDGMHIEIRAKANEKGMLYAAVNDVLVTEALAAKGVRVDKSAVRVRPIKTVGSFSAKVLFRHGLEADISVSIVPAK